MQSIRNKSTTRILVIAAHPDDEILGCGGSIAKLSREGCEVYVLFLGRGVASRYYGSKEKTTMKRKIKEIESQAREANEIIGTKEIFFYDFPDNMFDSVPLLRIVKSVEKVKNKVRPDVVFTHFRGDLNIDHRIAFEAAITATRPTPSEPVKEILSFEILSSTEWRYPYRFSPNVFIDISDTVDLKIQAMKAYKEELMEYPHPRSLESIVINAKLWGSKVGRKAAEAFELVRRIQ